MGLAAHIIASSLDYGHCHTHHSGMALPPPNSNLFLLLPCLVANVALCRPCCKALPIFWLPLHSPHSPNSLPKPLFLMPPHGAWQKQGCAQLIHTMPHSNAPATRWQRSASALITAPAHTQDGLGYSGDKVALVYAYCHSCLDSR